MIDGAAPVPGRAGIVVPTHNDGANIRALLRRLLDEPTVDEVVVVASGCTDDTVPAVTELAGAHPGRLRLYIEAERTGKASALNFGLRKLSSPYAVVVSGDVLPEPGAIPKLVSALQQPGVGLAGGRPVPVNDPATALGHSVHLLWRLHHRLALHQPKLGEMIALRAEVIVSLPRTSVDEACFQALIETAGWRSAYVPDAIVRNLGPQTVSDFVRQRRQIHTGHLWLRYKQRYAVPSLRLPLLAAELWRDVWASGRGQRQAHLGWTLCTAAMEAWARALARADYLQGKENHVWTMVASTKGPAIASNGTGCDRALAHVAPEVVGRRNGHPDGVARQPGNGSGEGVVERRDLGDALRVAGGEEPAEHLGPDHEGQLVRQPAEAVAGEHAQARLLEGRGVPALTAEVVPFPAGGQKVEQKELRAAETGLEGDDPSARRERPGRLLQETGRVVQMVEEVLGHDHVLAAGRQGRGDLGGVAEPEVAVDRRAGQA